MRIGSLFLSILIASAAVGCRSWINSMDTKMIERNAYSESVGMNQMLRDVEACNTQSVMERRRLKAELFGDDTYFPEQERREATGKAVGKEIGREMAEASPGPGMPTTRKASGEFDSERVAGDAGALAAGFIVAVLTSDSDKHEQKMLAMDLDNVKTFVRFKNMSLRAKRYEVPEYAGDGAGAAQLRVQPLRVVLVDGDGREVVMYQRPETE